MTVDMDFRSGVFPAGTPPHCTARYRFYIPERPPSLNEIKRKYRHPQAYKRLKTRWAALIRFHAATVAALARDSLAGPRSVKLTRIVGPGERDYDGDNLQGGLKPIRDALCRGTLIHPGLGLILDDRKETVTFEYHQVRGERAALVIDIEDLGSPCPG